MSETLPLKVDRQISEIENLRLVQNKSVQNRRIKIIGQKDFDDFNLRALDSPISP